MTTWEYTVRTRDRHLIGLQRFLNELGAEGWELCALLSSNGWSDQYIFKRKVAVGDNS